MGCVHRQTLEAPQPCAHNALCGLTPEFVVRSHKYFPRRIKWMVTGLGATIGVIGPTLVNLTKKAPTTINPFEKGWADLDLFLLATLLWWFIIWISTIIMMGQAKATSVSKQFISSIAYPFLILQTLALLAIK